MNAGKKSVMLKEVMRLLKLTDLTVEQISRRTGFSTPFYFSRVFTNEIGMPSGKYRGNTYRERDNYRQ